MLSESKRSAALMHFFLLVHGGIGLRDGEDDLAIGFVHILNAEHTDPELLHFLLQLTDKKISLLLDCPKYTTSAQSYPPEKRAVPGKN